MEDHQSNVAAELANTVDFHLASLLLKAEHHFPLDNTVNWSLVHCIAGSRDPYFDSPEFLKLVMLLHPKQIMKADGAPNRLAFATARGTFPSTLLSRMEKSGVDVSGLLPSSIQSP